MGSEGSDFTAWTKVGVEKLQAALGVTQNGVLSLGQVVFLPSAARITSLGTNTTVGGAAQPGQQIMLGTSTGRVVSIALDTGQQGEVAVGDKVTITMPNGQTTPGTVTSVGTVATTPSTGGGSPTINVLVTPDDPAATGTLDQAAVEVSITQNSANNAFVVPVDALLALSNGGYALEVVSPRGALPRARHDGDLRRCQRDRAGQRRRCGRGPAHRHPGDMSVPEPASGGGTALAPGVRPEPADGSPHRFSSSMRSRSPTTASPR